MIYHQVFPKHLLAKYHYNLKNFIKKLIEKLSKYFKHNCVSNKPTIKDFSHASPQFGFTFLRIILFLLEITQKVLLNISDEKLLLQALVLVYLKNYKNIIILEDCDSNMKFSSQKLRKELTAFQYSMYIQYIIQFHKIHLISFYCSSSKLFPSFQSLNLLSFNCLCINNL